LSVRSPSGAGGFCQAGTISSLKKRPGLGVAAIRRWWLLCCRRRISSSGHFWEVVVISPPSFPRAGWKKPGSLNMMFGITGFSHGFRGLLFETAASSWPACDEGPPHSEPRHPIFHAGPRFHRWSIGATHHRPGPQTAVPCCDEPQLCGRFGGLAGTLLRGKASRAKERAFSREVSTVAGLHHAAP